MSGDLQTNFRVLKHFDEKMETCVISKRALCEEYGFILGVGAKRTKIVYSKEISCDTSEGTDLVP